MSDDRNRQRADLKRPVHVKWDGKTIALGTFPPEEAEEKCARAKALTKKWRTTMRPKPSADWVKSALERLNIRVVYDRPGRPFLGASQGNRSNDRERQKKKQPQSYPPNIPPPSQESSLRDDGIGGIPRDHPYGAEGGASALPYGTDPGRGSMQHPDLPQAGGGGLQSYYNMGTFRGGMDERGRPTSGLNNPPVGDIMEGRYPYGVSSYLYPKSDALGGDEDAAKSKLSGINPKLEDRYPDDPDASQSYDSRHYEMLKNHHMNLLRELQETTMLMNTIRRKQEHRQQQKEQQQQQYGQSSNPMPNPSSYASYPHEIQSQLARLSNMHHPQSQRPSINSSPMRMPPSYQNLHSESLLDALGSRGQRLAPFDPAGYEASLLNQHSSLGGDLAHRLDRPNLNDVVSPGGLERAESALFQRAMERRLSGNPAAAGGGRLDYGNMGGLRDRFGLDHPQRYTGASTSTTGGEPWTKETAPPGPSAAALTEKPDFSDSLFAAPMAMDSSASGSVDRKQSDASSIRRQSDASRSSYQPYPQQEVDDRLQSTRTSKPQELVTISERPQQLQSPLQAPQERPDLKERKVGDLHLSSTSGAASQEASREDLTAATNLTNFHQQSSQSIGAGSKRDSSWLKTPEEVKDNTEEIESSKGAANSTTKAYQPSEPIKKRHTTAVASSSGIPDKMDSNEDKIPSEISSYVVEKDGKSSEEGKVAEC